MKDFIKWLLEQLLYLFITAGALSVLGLMNTVTQMYLIEH